jgi:hypothetical protein
MTRKWDSLFSIQSKAAILGISYGSLRPYCSPFPFCLSFNKFHIVIPHFENARDENLRVLMASIHTDQQPEENMHWENRKDNDLEPRSSERTISMSLETLRASVRRVDGKINEWSKRLPSLGKAASKLRRGSGSLSTLNRPSTASPDDHSRHNDEKLLQVLGFIPSDESSDSDSDIEPKPRRKVKNLVEYLGGPSIELPLHTQRRISGQSKDSQRILNAEKEDELRNSNSIKLQGDIEPPTVERFVPVFVALDDTPIEKNELKSIEIMETPRDTEHLDSGQLDGIVNDEEQRNTDIEIENDSSTKTKDLCKFLGAASPTALSMPAVVPDSNRFAFRRKSSRSKNRTTSSTFHHMLKNSSPDVKNALKLVHYHIHNPPEEPSTPSPSMISLELKKEQIQNFAAKAKQKVRKAIKIIHHRAMTFHQTPKPSTTPEIPLQMETIEYKSVVDQIEQFKREVILKARESATSVSHILGSKRDVTPAFFHEAYEFRIIDLIRTPKWKWIEFCNDCSVQESNETLSNSACEIGSLNHLSPEFIRIMLTLDSSKMPPARKPVTITFKKQLSTERRPKMSLDVESIIQNILSDVPFKREIFRDELWQLPNHEAYPELFGEDSMAILSSSAQEVIEHEQHASSIDLLTIRLNEIQSSETTDDDELSQKLHPLDEAVPYIEPSEFAAIARRRCATQIDAEQTPNSHGLRQSISVHNAYGFQQLAKLNKVIEEETKGLEQLRRVNAVLLQDSHINDKDNALSTIKKLALSIPSLAANISGKPSLEAFEPSVPSFTSIPEQPDTSDVPKLVKYMFRHPGREIFVDGLGAAEMISATNLEHADDTDRKSITSVSQLLLDAIESSVVTP